MVEVFEGEEKPEAKVKLQGDEPLSDETKAKLVEIAKSLGFDKHAKKPGLFVKDLGEDTYAYIDFRRSTKGFRYATAGADFIPHEALDSIPELKQFKELRDKLLAGEPVDVEEPVEESHASEESKVISPPKEPEDFALLDARDEEQIIEELRGRVLTEYVYQFRSGGRTVIGLSLAGVRAIARAQGNIKLSELHIEDLPDAYLATVKASTPQFESYGVFKQPKRMKLKDGREVEDEFALQKAVSKAQRNAIRGVIPERVALEMVNEWLKTKKAQEVSSQG